MNHALNYRRALPFGTIFGLAAIAATVIFIVYAAEWHDLNNSLTFDGLEVTNRYVKAVYAYQATVLALLMLIVFFSGYHITHAK